MGNHYIAVQSFLHEVDCFCPDKEHLDWLKVRQGDIINIQHERTYNMVNGWYVLIEVNDSSFYIAVEDLNQYYIRGLFISEIDIELRVNYLKFRIDEALENSDEGKFYELTEEWLDFKNYRELLAAADSIIQYIS
ncbi:IDEAL domain-containing protein [Rossellomorea vietnamensis]|uniref:IDEAL domain-containing protein n=1 Tax=Rossellomorea vietnamensis TaxID=218284 RepID=A0A5D4M7D9_9BACI|nr:IDEAL domain-containing protein [Rossellomorea vietnamensis]TYR97397.1 IDEAL domain-containing protein [Rossellomorea vietnamensis]